MLENEDVASLLEQLTGAVGRGEMELHFQPEIDLTGGTVTAMEALLRWAHPGRGMLWPADFLPTAEQGGLTPALGAWVLGRALQEARHFAPGTRIWVNASVSELADPRYPARVQQALSGVSSAAGVVGVDVPEASLVSLGVRAAEVCSELRAAGAALALEYSGQHPEVLAELGRYGIEIVKIGRALVREIDSSAEKRSEVEHIVTVVAAAGGSVTAGGVESWAEAHSLQQLGVVRAHGFLLSPPMRADRVRWALGRGDVGRGSYLQDGSGWLTSSRYAAALHDVLPHGGAPEGDRRSGAGPGEGPNRSVTSTYPVAPRSAPVDPSAAPASTPPMTAAAVPAVAPAVAPVAPVAPLVAPPLRPQRAGLVAGVTTFDPFGRHEARAI